MTDAARAFRGFRFPAEVILWAVRWYLQFPISYRDLEAMLADRGVAVDHTTMYRWVQRFAPELEKRMAPPPLWCGCGTSTRLTSGLSRQWRYLYRAVDGTGQTNRFPAQCQAAEEGSGALLQAGSRQEAAPLQPARGRYRSPPPSRRAARDEAEGWSRWRFARHRRGRGFNNRVEQDHRRIKARPGPCSAFSARTGPRRPASRRWQCWPRDRCVPCLGMTCQRSEPLYNRFLALRPERREAGQGSPAVSQRPRQRRGLRAGLCRVGARCARTGRSRDRAAACLARCPGAGAARSAAATRSPRWC